MIDEIKVEERTRWDPITNLRLAQIDCEHRDGTRCAAFFPLLK